MTVSDRRPGFVLFVVCLVSYTALGYFLFRTGYINPDATSRTGNAGYVVMSRFPHLGAVGFVWNPLPSFAQIPLLSLSHWWPELKTLGLSGVIQSAGFMAGAVVLIRRIAIDAGASTVVRVLAVAAFALNPMIVLYGANGMSEGAFCLVLLWACRRLIRWVRREATVDLCMAGLAFGTAYLVRYEALIAAAAAVTLVVGVSLVRHRATKQWKSAAHVALHDGVIMGFPITCAFVVWALSGWFLDASLLAQFTSQYGNSAQVATVGIVGVGDVGVAPLLKTIAASVFGIEPLALVVVAAAGAASVYWRRYETLVPIMVFGSILLFQSVAILLGSTFGWFRFFIVLVPLVIVALLTSWPASSERTAAVRFTHTAISAVMAATLISSIPATWQSMLNPAIGKEEYGLRSVLWPEQYPPSEFWYFWSGEIAENTVRWFDDQDLPDGSVLMDTFGLARMWLASEDPHQFVVRSDYDFFDKLNQPSESGLRYILVPRPSGLGKLDAVNIRYPTIWDDGAGIGTLVMTVTGPNGGQQFRILRVHPRE
ncbi:hypothetical protein C6A87_003005 [Mycobacterium sp. ITM-2016-00317]|uniref:hypothetical protein n=1 Tax=Mycobacterium sp. ITM-2016-00317 TaxID=2099694 RepID=UPI00287FAE98|nr:hypothetical protein [Mycobacterium sp. ITM-2016-00317]WNG88242.1 hypothetical protein C6A87_003005 [Mycobacterium sp. ITM-2016-00317]